MYRDFEANKDKVMWLGPLTGKGWRLKDSVVCPFFLGSLHRRPACKDSVGTVKKLSLQRENWHVPLKRDVKHCHKWMFWVCNLHPEKAIHDNVDFTLLRHLPHCPYIRTLPFMSIPSPLAIIWPQVAWVILWTLKISEMSVFECK